jgi:hypothetical protein
MSDRIYTASLYATRGDALRAYVRDIADELSGDEKVIVVIRRPGGVFEDDVRHEMASVSDMHHAAAAITEAAQDLA